MNGSITPTPGRIVLCWWPAKWDGPRPGMIVRVDGDTPHAPCSVNVQVDTTVDRTVPNGTTLNNVQVYQPGAFNPVEANPSQPWCEWMPYQAGQAARTEAISVGLMNELHALRNELQALKDELGATAPHELDPEKLSTAG